MELAVIGRLRPERSGGGDERGQPSRRLCGNQLTPGGSWSAGSSELRDSSLWFSSQTSPSSYNWSNWTTLGGQITNAPAVVDNADKRLELFVRGQMAPCGTIGRRAPEGVGRIGPACMVSWPGGPAAALNASRLLDAFVGGYYDGFLWEITQSSPGTFKRTTVRWTPKTIRVESIRTP